MSQLIDKDTEEKITKAVAAASGAWALVQKVRAWKLKKKLKSAQKLIDKLVGENDAKAKNVRNFPFT